MIKGLAAVSVVLSPVHIVSSPESRAIQTLTLPILLKTLGNLDNAKYFEERVINIPSSVIV